MKLIVLLGLTLWSLTASAQYLTEEEALNFSASHPVCAKGQCRVKARVMWFSSVPINDGIAYFKNKKEAYIAGKKIVDADAKHFGSFQAQCTGTGGKYIDYSERDGSYPTINGVVYKNSAATCEHPPNSEVGIIVSAKGFCPIGYSFVPSYEEFRSGWDTVPNVDGGCVALKSK